MGADKLYHWQETCPSHGNDCLFLDRQALSKAIVEAVGQQGCELDHLDLSGLGSVDDESLVRAGQSLGPSPGIVFENEAQGK